MTRRRYVQSKEPPYELIEITDDHRPEMRADAGVLWGDRHYDGLKATDGADISTRTKHREYMKANGVTMADDFKQTWAQAKEQRERQFTQGGSFTKADIARAMQQVQNRR